MRLFPVGRQCNVRVTPRPGTGRVLVNCGPDAYVFSSYSLRVSFVFSSYSPLVSVGQVSRERVGPWTIYYVQVEGALAAAFSTARPEPASVRPVFAALLCTLLFSISITCGHRSAKLIGGTEANFWRLSLAGAAAGRLGLCVWHRRGRRGLSAVLPERGRRHRDWRRGLLPDLAAAGLAAHVAADRLPERPVRRAH